MPSPARTQVLDALRQLSDHGPVTVSALVAEVTRRGFRTADQLGVSHAVRATLQRLKAERRVAYLGPNQWQDLAARRAQEAPEPLAVPGPSPSAPRP